MWLQLLLLRVLFEEARLTPLLLLLWDLLAGDLTGDLAGDLAGDFTGDLAGEFTGDLTGDLADDLTGDLEYSRIGEGFFRAGGERGG